MVDKIRPALGLIRTVVGWAYVAYNTYQIGSDVLNAFRNNASEENKDGDGARPQQAASYELPPDQDIE